MHSIHLYTNNLSWYKSSEVVTILTTIRVLPRSIYYDIVPLICILHCRSPTFGQLDDGRSIETVMYPVLSNIATRSLSILAGARVQLWKIVTCLGLDTNAMQDIYAIIESSIQSNKQRNNKARKEELASKIHKSNISPSPTQWSYFSTKCSNRCKDK